MTLSTAQSRSLATTLLDDADPSPLFTPFTLGDAALSNRFVMAPMTRGFSPGGVPGPEVAEYYRRRAAHMGLIVTEGTYIDHPSAGGSTSVPRFYDADALAGWKHVVDAVHEVGGRIFPQLWHIGVTRHEWSGPHPESPTIGPSGLGSDGAPFGRAASLADIDAIIASFARAALTAKEIGFDGVELHGAHGYLLDAFLWSRTNQRTDRYGGSIAARTRLSEEVVAAVRDAVGPDFPVVFRYSQWKGADFDAQIASTAQELDTVLAPLAAAGVSAFHVSTRRYWLPAFAGDDRTLAGWTKSLTGLPTIALGSVGVGSPFLGADAELPSLSLARLIELFERGEFDLVGLGRAVLSEPTWTAKLRDRRLDEIRLYEKSHEEELF
ncbi:2,4-dienoyl-CoA reductase-like NADH-dependent reductase (Old Yellow Enzyme family) [Leucobacter exalbidus]|uniref:2,4-dienoyl-CoA reductase-like NADH-dependent reductase (Old Yellow Enzyme family) n=1 Tax=Leucobacter exalbidus TaxID=662960 RepID=A0A940PJQ4_9MICO|nr:NADH:flavin oxidoreductase [Leucobacter exalbidus]MBP1325162.1 2,4-dienoyl-CoA reductase-like NADH-dependent reductase (Old Yellow Enzyme family) [Leucobacter exalbidus]